jgi:hypothetical protein
MNDIDYKRIRLSKPTQAEHTMALPHALHVDVDGTNEEWDEVCEKITFATERISKLMPRRFTDANKVRDRMLQRLDGIEEIHYHEASMECWSRLLNATDAIYMLVLDQMFNISHGMSTITKIDWIQKVQSFHVILGNTVRDLRKRIDDSRRSIKSD